MTILIIANSESVHTTRFANEFIKRGYQVSLISTTPYLNRVVSYHKEVNHIVFLNRLTKLFTFLFNDQIKKHNPENSKWYHPMNFLVLFRMIYLLLFIDNVIKKEAFEAIFSTNLTINGLISSRIKRKVPKICQILGCDVYLAKWNSREVLTNNKFIYRYVYNNLNYIISAREKQFIDFFNNKSLFKNSNKVLYSNGLGVDVEHFSPKYKDPLIKKQLYTLEKDSILAVCFRQPRPQLDFEGILNALPIVIEKYPNFYFAIGTGGLEFNNLKMVASSLKIEKNVLFIDKVAYEDLNLYIAQGDLYIDPINIHKYPTTISLGISGSLLESISCGLIPVIGDRPGLDVYFDNQHYNFVYNDLETELGLFIIKAIDSINDVKIKNSFRNIVVEKSNWSNTVNLILNKFN